MLKTAKQETVQLHTIQVKHYRQHRLYVNSAWPVASGHAHHNGENLSQILTNISSTFPQNVPFTQIYTLLPKAIDLALNF